MDDGLSAYSSGANRLRVKDNIIAPCSGKNRFTLQTCEGIRSYEASKGQKGFSLDLALCMRSWPILRARVGATQEYNTSTHAAWQLLILLLHVQRSLAHAKRTAYLVHCIYRVRVRTAVVFFGGKVRSSCTGKTTNSHELASLPRFCHVLPE